MMYSVEELLSGQVLLVDKPLGWTSFQVVNKLKWTILNHYPLKKIKIGHAGTLDPLATGLLIVCTGKYTKKISTYQSQQKVYSGVIMLGATTPSYDMETEKDKTYPTNHITPAQIQVVTEKYKGEIRQKPPIYSAIKKEGKRLYEYARQGKNVEIKSRTVTIYDFKTSYNKNDHTVKFLVTCSKGTYIRSLAYDFGLSLDTGAYLSQLVREEIGDYALSDAVSVEDWVERLSINIDKE